jgi:PAS domain-containing protein
VLRGKHTEGRREESEGWVQRGMAELQTIYASVPVGLAFVDKELRFASINETLAELNGFLRSMSTSGGRWARYCRRSWPSRSSRSTGA